MLFCALTNWSPKPTDKNSEITKSLHSRPMLSSQGKREPCLINGVQLLKRLTFMRILRDTACSQSVILASALPFSDQSACEYGAVLRGVEMGFALRPVHCVHVESNLITGFFPVAVCPELPIEGIDFLMGNDIAGGKVTPALEVLYTPLRIDDGKPSPTELELYPACAVTRAQARKNVVEDVPLSDSVLMSVFSEEPVPSAETEASPVPSPASPAEPKRTDSSTPPSLDSLSPLPLTREHVSVEQRGDPTLQQMLCPGGECR